MFAQYLLSYRVNHLKFPPLIPALFLGTVGAVGVTVLLGVINFSFGRQFLFFAEQLKLVSDFIADSSQQKTWWEPWSSLWYLNFPYMGVFFAGTLLSIVTLAHRSTTAVDLATLCLCELIFGRISLRRFCLGVLAIDRPDGI